MDSANANQEVTSKQQSSDFFSVKKRSKKKWTEEEKAEKKRQLKLRREENKSNKNTSFTGDCIDHTEYYFENGLRKVKPYMYKWHTTTKERWFGKTLIELYTQEFSRALHNVDVGKLVDTGIILVNDKLTNRDYRLKNGDTITQFKHRHELPVIGDPIQIVFDSEDILAVNKPCSIPMHPCGKYRYNTLALILLKEMNYKNLRTIYRIDRLTSGVVVFAKNFQMAKILDKQIKDRTAIKNYLCRVDGKFPEKILTVDQPIDCLSRKTGLQWINQNGKAATTQFEFLSYNGKSSVVKCMPKTGRTHQIRVHLQFLGYPIVNDPLYNDKEVWGKFNGKDGSYEKTPDQIEKDFLAKHQQDFWIIDEEQNIETESEKREEVETIKVEESNKTGIDEIVKRKADDELACETKKLKTNEDIKNNNPNYDPDCYECQQIFRDPPKKDLIMYLHALTYKFGEMEFRTDMPKWAEDNFNESIEDQN